MTVDSYSRDYADGLDRLVTAAESIASGLADLVQVLRERDEITEDDPAYRVALALEALVDSPWTAIPGVRGTNRIRREGARVTAPSEDVDV